MKKQIFISYLSNIMVVYILLITIELYKMLSFNFVGLVDPSQWDKRIPIILLLAILFASPN